MRARKTDDMDFVDGIGEVRHSAEGYAARGRGGSRFEHAYGVHRVLCQ